METDTERADRITRGHAKISPFLGLLILVIHQGVFFSWNWNAVGWWQIAVWLAFIGLILTILMTGGALFVPRKIRALANDEVTRANRAVAIQTGFFVAMFIAVLLVVVSPFDPIEGQRAGHMLISISLGITLLVFGLREMMTDG